MTPKRTLRAEAIAVLAAVAAAAAWLQAGSIERRDPPLQLAQEVIYGSPIGEDDGPIGGAPVYGEAVGSAPIGGPMVYGEAVGSAPIGGPMLYGDPVGSAPIGGPSMYGAPVGSGGDDQPIGGDTLY